MRNDQACDCISKIVDKFVSLYKFHTWEYLCPLNILRYERTPKTPLLTSFVFVLFFSLSDPKTEFYYLWSDQRPLKGKTDLIWRTLAVCAWTWIFDAQTKKINHRIMVLIHVNICHANCSWIRDEFTMNSQNLFKKRVSEANYLRIHREFTNNSHDKYSRTVKPFLPRRQEHLLPFPSFQ